MFQYSNEEKSCSNKHYKEKAIFDIHGAYPHEFCLGD